MTITKKTLTPSPFMACELAYYTPLVALTAIYIIAVYAFAEYHGLETMVRIGMYSPLATIFLLILFAIWLLRLAYDIFSAMIRSKTPPTTIILDKFLSSIKPCNLMEIALPMTLLSLFNAANTSFKVFIGMIKPFHLDPLFASIDRTLHGGTDPWQITHALVSSTSGTMIIDLFYTTWLLVMWGFLSWHVLRLQHQEHRHQFFRAYVLCWSLLGSLLAYALSSAGPCYYGMLYDGPDIYAPLMERLHHAKNEIIALNDWRDIRALNGQSYLWSSYTAVGVLPGSGISAAPSLHVSIAVLFALSAWRVHHTFGWIMIAYAVTIMFGSVHLGWHYAIDGYLAIILTIGVWFFSGWLVRRWAGIVRA